MFLDHWQVADFSNSVIQKQLEKQAFHAHPSLFGVTWKDQEDETQDATEVTSEVSYVIYNMRWLLWNL